MVFFNLYNDVNVLLSICDRMHSPAPSDLDEDKYVLAATCMRLFDTKGLLKYIAIINLFVYFKYYVFKCLSL